MFYFYLLLKTSLYVFSLWKRITGENKFIVHLNNVENTASTTEQVFQEKKKAYTLM